VVSNYELDLNSSGCGSMAEFCEYDEKTNLWVLQNRGDYFARGVTINCLRKPKHDGGSYILMCEVASLGV
jgi:hypothetical protein